MRRVVAIALFFTGAMLHGQSITGTVTGSVKDPSGQSLVGAEVDVLRPATGVSRSAKTDVRGDFLFSDLEPGEYQLRVAHPGFKRLVKNGISLSASETLAAGELVLEVGAANESVTVSAELAEVQTASGEHAGLITAAEVSEMLNMSRNVMDLLELLPGVVNNQEGTHQSLDRAFDINVQGNRNTANNFTLNGMSINAIGNNTNSVINVSQDSVAEVKVLLSNYSAEFGRMSGPTVQVVTKSGTKSFHGGGSYFWRNEEFNANNFFNNRLNLPKPLYRYHTWAGNVGGPVPLPGNFNRERNKLFFFFSEEYWPSRYSSAIGQLTVPTQLEKNGDFSQSRNAANNLITVKDPLTQLPFAGNVVPLSRIDRNGQALLNIFPLPNFNNRGISAGQYNYIFQAEDDTPQRTETVKIDYNANPKDLIFFNFNDYLQVQQGFFLTANWPQMTTRYEAPGKLYVLHYQHIFSPTLVNEFNFGFSNRPEIVTAPAADLQRNQRSSSGYNAGQLYPQDNSLNLIPNATFGGVTQPANLTIYGRFPPLGSKYQSLLSTGSLTDLATKTFGPHTIKAGIYADRFWTTNRNSTNFNGSFNFGAAATNPLDTGYAYANALVGVYQTYSEISARPGPQLTTENVEWFLQDNWKVNRRLTLDYGIRFCWIEPVSQSAGLVPGFDPSQFNPSQEPRLITPALVGGKRVGVNPVTGELYNAILIGAIAPGTGNLANGMVLPASQPGYPNGLANDRGINYAPRFGFAFDPFGHGRTAIRGGFGMFYNREPTVNTLYNLVSQPPIANNQNLYYGTLDTLLGSSGYIFPNSVNGLDRIGKIPTVMNSSFIVEQRIAAGTIVTVGYVGSLARHLMWERDLNSIPLGADFNPKNADPATPSVPLTANFLRPMQGYASVIYSEWAASSNYHSMQATANRRFAHGLQISAAWTWSKSMDYNSADASAVTTLVPVRVWNYGLSTFDRTHIFQGNWVYDLPRTPFRNRVAKYVLNEWELSGRASFVSGAPLGISLTTTNGADITGSASISPRPVVVGNPVMPKGDRTFNQNFRTDVFRLPAKGTVGDEARTVIRGPGINNWNIGLFKNLPLHEKIRLQLRCEAYNAFNHTQFSTLNTTAQFNPQGVQMNALLGQFTAARPSRVMQFALRLSF